MRLKKDSTAQKIRGAYYTPYELASLIVKTVNPHQNLRFKTILEPSCGDGIFIDAIKNACNFTDCSIDAVEIEPAEAEKARKKSEGYKNINVITDDFFTFYETHKEERYDLIIGNPPYIRYQFLTPEQREIQTAILTSNGMKSNKLINAWVAFLVACIEMLSNNGTIAFIIPAELLQVAFAEDLRRFIVKELGKTTIITFEKLVFDVEQEVIVFVGEKTQQRKGLRIRQLSDLSDWNKVCYAEDDFIPTTNHEDKWTKFFVSNEEIQLLERLKTNPSFAPLSSFGIVNVGITTGDNNFFSIEEALEKEYDLERYCRPLIGRSSHAHGVFFTEDDWRKNRDSGKKASLLDLNGYNYEDLNAGVKRYIKYGESLEINKGYKTGIREEWYKIPSIWVPDAFFLRRNNLYPKLVINNCDAVSTDTMHRIKLYEGVDPDLILLGYYNSISFAFTEICGRSYGGGVLEVLPREAGNVLIANIKKLNPKKKSVLIERLDNIIRTDAEIEEALDLIDREILIEELHVDKEICETCRSIWKKLQKRRINRGDL